jgi:hypothetical protein
MAKISKYWLAVAAAAPEPKPQQERPVSYTELESWAKLSAPERVAEERAYGKAYPKVRSAQLYGKRPVRAGAPPPRRKKHKS